MAKLVVVQAEQACERPLLVGSGWRKSYPLFGGMQFVVRVDGYAGMQDELGKLQVFAIATGTFAAGAGEPLPPPMLLKMVAKADKRKRRRTVVVEEAEPGCDEPFVLCQFGESEPITTAYCALRFQREIMSPDHPGATRVISATLPMRVAHTSVYFGTKVFEYVFYCERGLDLRSEERMTWELCLCFLRRLFHCGGILARRLTVADELFVRKMLEACFGYTRDEIWEWVQWLVLWCKALETDRKPESYAACWELRVPFVVPAKRRRTITMPELRLLPPIPDTKEEESGYLINGFVTKADAEGQLAQCSGGSFIVRFGMPRTDECAPLVISKRGADTQIEHIQVDHNSPATLLDKLVAHGCTHLCLADGDRIHRVPIYSFISEKRDESAHYATSC